MFATECCLTVAPFDVSHLAHALPIFGFFPAIRCSALVTMVSFLPAQHKRESKRFMSEAPTSKQHRCCVQDTFVIACKQAVVA